MSPGARGNDWNGIDTAREGGTQRYIAHLLKLAWLAPDVMQAINAGTFPAHITLEQLKKGLPLEWNARREAFGLAAQTR
jgi:hypothetical protein